MSTIDPACKPEGKTLPRAGEVSTYFALAHQVHQNIDTAAILEEADVRSLIRVETWAAVQDHESDFPPLLRSSPRRPFPTPFTTSLKPSSKRPVTHPWLASSCLFSLQNSDL